MRKSDQISIASYLSLAQYPPTLEFGVKRVAGEHFSYKHHALEGLDYWCCWLHV